MKIGILGAFSRYNYGDVLMPYIVSESLKKRMSGISFEFYSYKESDLTEIGGIPSKSLKDLYLDSDNLDWVIVAGGQVFGQEHKGMYVLEFDMNHPKRTYFAEICFKVLGKICGSVVNAYCRRRIGAKSSYPWVVEKPFDGNKIIYNTVGGNFNSFKKDKRYVSMINTLSKSPMIAIRSLRDYNIWKTVLNNVSLIPDSVSVISDIYNDQKLGQLCQAKNKKKIDELKSYFVFQISRENAKNREEELAAVLEEACKINDLKCLLVPMGYAAGHEDQIACRNINTLTSPNVEILDKASIFDITYALSQAQAYLGTSLHGAIVSCSYGVPHSTIIVNNKKTEEYITNWKTSLAPACDIENIPKTLHRILESDSKKYTKNKSKEIITMINDNFDKICKIMNN